MHCCYHFFACFLTLTHAYTRSHPHPHSHTHSTLLPAGSTKGPKYYELVKAVTDDAGAVTSFVFPTKRMMKGKGEGSDSEGEESEKSEKSEEETTEEGARRSLLSSHM